MKKIVVSGSISLNYEELFKDIKNKGFEIIEKPKVLTQSEFNKVFPEELKRFFTSIENTDIYLLYNANKNGIAGYIGENSYAEFYYAIAQNLLHGKNIEIYVYQMPDENLTYYDEIKILLDNNLIKLWYI